MAASDTHVTDPLDTVHHQMDSTVRSHRYITQRGSVIHCPTSIILLGEGGKEEA